MKEIFGETRHFGSSVHHFYLDKTFQYKVCSVSFFIFSSILPFSVIGLSGTSTYNLKFELMFEELWFLEEITDSFTRLLISTNFETRLNFIR